jgi:hypothetical protein
MQINTHKLSILARSPAADVTRVMPVTTGGRAGFLPGASEQDPDHASVTSANRSRLT